MSSLFSFGGGASVIASTGAVLTAAAAGAVAAAVLTAGATQVAENATQPDPTTANLSNVSAPNYAD